MRLFSSSATIEKRLYAIRPPLFINLPANRTDVCQEFGWNLREEFHASLVISLPVGLRTCMYIVWTRRYAEFQAGTYIRTRRRVHQRLNVTSNVIASEKIARSEGEDEPVCRGPRLFARQTRRLRFYLPIAFHFDAADRIKSRYLTILDSRKIHRQILDYWNSRKITWYSWKEIFHVDSSWDDLRHNCQIFILNKINKIPYEKIPWFFLKEFYFLLFKFTFEA